MAESTATDSRPDARRWSLLIGLAASIAYLGALAVPYLLIGTPGVRTYYRHAFYGRNVLAVVGVLTLVGFAVGLVWFDRPSFVSGVLAGLGLLVGGFTWAWALSVRPSAVMGMPVTSEFVYHRWLLALLSSVVAALGCWSSYRLYGIERSEPATGWGSDQHDTKQQDMSYDTDKYPPASGRRQFVKGIIGSAVLVGIGGAAMGAVEVSTNPSGIGGGLTQYYGNTVVDGPAPRGMPQIPLEIDSDGFVKGIWPDVTTETREGQPVAVAEMQLGGTTYSSEWYQYCGMEANPGLAPDAEVDNYFRYIDAPPYAWQQQAVTAGDRVAVSDFDDYERWGNDIGRSGLGKPAMVQWRSKDTGGEVVPVQLIRSPIVETRADGDEWLDASTAQGFIANLDKCTHFCCVPGFKALAQSTEFGAENRIYCPCHQSVYAPFEIEQQTFVSYPRPTESGGE
ncbi:MAG: hypothetical protein ABEI77_08540 [Halorientalis sp.]